jgi:hypothetical protein
MITLVIMISPLLSCEHLKPVYQQTCKASLYPKIEAIAGKIEADCKCTPGAVQEIFLKAPRVVCLDAESRALLDGGVLSQGLCKASKDALFGLAGLALASGLQCEHPLNQCMDTAVLDSLVDQFVCGKL